MARTATILLVSVLIGTCGVMATIWARHRNATGGIETGAEAMLYVSPEDRQQSGDYTDGFPYRLDRIPLGTRVRIVEGDASFSNPKPSDIFGVIVVEGPFDGARITVPRRNLRSIH